MEDLDMPLQYSHMLRSGELEGLTPSGFVSPDFPVRKPLASASSSTLIIQEKNDEYVSLEDIERGLEDGEFEVHYQPIIDISTKKILSGEALVRWNHPRLGLLFPKSFISIAEDTGAIHRLGEFVLRNACAQSVRWKMEGHESFKVTVNVSMLQLADPHFVSKVLQILQEEGISAYELELEITESLAMIDPENTRKALFALKDVGIKVLLDDFGAGYSSLNHLRQFPVHGLKIDGQFIRQSLRSEKDKNLMHSIVLLARALDLVMVAEGVENEEQFLLLERMDCNSVQGFYYTHPLPAAEYREWCTTYTEPPVKNNQ